MKKLILFFVPIFITSFLLAQPLQQAIQLLNNNQRSEALSALTKLENDPTNRVDAALAATLQEVSNEHWDEAFTHFQQVFNTSPIPYPYLYALWTTGIFNNTLSKNNEAERLKMMEKISTDPKANATIKSMAFDNLAGKALNSNNLKEAKLLYNKINDVRGWSTVGIFDNTSASGFNKDFGVLAHPETNYDFKNAHGTMVRWFNIPDARTDRWLDLEYSHLIGNSVVYAQTFITCDADKDVAMLLGLSGSFKIWVNDFLIGQEAEERNTDLVVYNYKVKLQKGVNRVLIQIGSSDIDRANFMLRFADNNGNTLPITGSPTALPYTKAVAYEVKMISMFAETFFLDKLAENPNSFVDMMLLLNVYSHNDKRYEGRKLIQQLKKMASNSTLVSEKAIECYSRDKNSTAATKEFEFIKSNDPNSMYGIALRYQEAYNKEDFDSAKILLNQRIQLYGANAETATKSIDILGKKKDYENVVKELDKAYKMYPGNRAFTAMEYGVMQSINKDPKKSNKLLEDYLQDHYDVDIVSAVSENLMKMGKKDEGMKMLKKMSEDRPYAVGNYNNIADKYFAMQDYHAAALWQQKAIDLAPYVGKMHYSKGTILDAKGDKADAKTELRKAVELTPNNYDARKKLRELEGKKGLFSYFKTNDIAALVKNSPKQSDYPNDNSVYLLKDLQQIVYPESGASEERNELLIKVLNQSGIDDWKEVNVPYNSYTQRLIFDKIELLKKDGSKVQAENNQSQIVFSSLEVGDIVHISYKLETSTYGKLAEHFWEDFNFNGGNPIKMARYSLIEPAAKKFQYKMYNTDIKPTITTIDEYKQYTWEKADLPAVQPEPGMPPFTDISERVVVTSIPDWNYVANWYSDLSGAKAKGDFEVKEKANELFEGKHNLSELEKAKVIYDYIEGNFNYSSVPFLHSALTPQRASRTINTKLGDCKDLSTLFVALAKQEGLNANLILVDTRNNGDINLDLPTIGFNHCIAQLKTKDNKNYIIELTDNNLPFGAMNFHDINANGLYIPKDGEMSTDAKLVKLNTPNRSANFIDRTSTIIFNGKKVDIERSSKKMGAEASASRANYKNKGLDDRNRELTTSLSGEFNKKIGLKSFTLTDLDNLKDTVGMDYKFTVDNFTSEIVGMQIFKLPWSDTYGSVDFVSLENRKYPFNLWSFSSTPREREVMTIILPVGKKLAEEPKNVSISIPSISYNLSFIVKPDRIIATREVKYLKEQVSVAEYPLFKEFIGKMNESDNKQMGFK